MTDCYSFTKNLSEYLEGNLKESQQRLCKHHLDTCSICSEKYEQIKLMRKSLSSLPKYKTTSTFDIILRSRIRAQINKDSRLRFFTGVNTAWRLPAFAAAALILIAASIFVDRSIGNRDIILTDKTQAKNLINTAQLQPRNDIQGAEDVSRTSIKMKNYVIEHYKLPDLLTGNGIELAGKDDFILDRTSMDSASRAKPASNFEPRISSVSTTIRF